MGKSANNPWEDEGKLWKEESEESDSTVAGHLGGAEQPAPGQGKFEEGDVRVVCSLYGASG